ncbi:MAG: ABC transporter ATP-binding protein [Rhizobiaceae bacterium]|nr:ABC transporter ATP-binding protein [Rhizobiaceae bacterium]
MTGKKISLNGISKRYGDFVAVSDMSLTVEPGEFVSFLGPSGCGKTTTLRMIAGFIMPDSGALKIGDVEVTYLPPNKRDLSFVFQNYALWPHMTVAENIGFGPKLAGLSRADIDKRIRDALSLTALSGLESRFPRQLSGGQQQRVAVARALALGRSVLLMDEPLSNLDRKLRVDMRKELKELQRRLNITTVYVTHDQEEALSMSDRVAVMDRGRIASLAVPEEIYRNPPNEFVASFVGGVNYFNGTLRHVDSSRSFFIADDGLEFHITRRENTPEGTVRLMTRPEWIVLRSGEDKGLNTHPVTVDFIEYLGASRKVSATTETGRKLLIQVHDVDPMSIEVGDRLTFHIAAQNMMLIK